MSGREKLRDLTPEQRARLQRKLEGRWGEGASGGPREEAPPSGRPERRLAPQLDLQRIYWRIWRGQSRSPFGNSPTVLRFRAPEAPESPGAADPEAAAGRAVLDPGALSRAWSALTARHGALRTRLAELDGRLVQIVEPSAPVALPWVDLSGLPAERREEALTRAATAAARRTFQLDRCPLTRTLVLSCGPRDRTLVAIRHHSITDGWSDRVLTRELITLYGALLQGAPEAARAPEDPPELARAVLGEPPGQLADWVAAWAERLEAPATGDGQEGGGESREEELLAHWQGVLAGLPRPALALPTHGPGETLDGAGGGALDPWAGGAVRRSVPPETRETLARVAAGSAVGCTLFMVVLAALLAALGRWAEQDEATVLTTLADREESRWQGAAGLLLRTVPLRLDLSGRPTFAELVGRLRARFLEAVEHRDVPWDRLLERLDGDTAAGPAGASDGEGWSGWDRNNHPFPVAVSFQSLAVGGAAESLSLRAEPVELPPQGVPKHLLIYLLDRGEGAGLDLEILYRRRRFAPEAVERLADRLVELLGRAAASPESSMARLLRPLFEELPPAESDRVDSAVPYGPDPHLEPSEGE